MPVFNHDELRRYLRQRLQDAGVATAVADEVADNLVESSLQGHDSHGVTLIPRYIEAIRAGELDPQATPQLLRDAGPVISFHGGNGFGQLTGRLAMEQAILRVAVWRVHYGTGADPSSLGASAPGRNRRRRRAGIPTLR
jgi:uncharacterized oxidoreductase